MNQRSYTTATDQEVLASLGTRLRKLRELRGLTQAEAAERAGLSRPTLSRAERGQNPTLHTLIRMLRAYGRIGALESFIQAPDVSPMARLRERKAKGEKGRDGGDGEGEGGG